MRRALRSAACAFWVLAACRALPEIPANTCGNHVIEEGEDCDGFPVLGAECRLPGREGECHLDCSTADDGPGSCPAGFGCDQDGVCRHPTGSFVAAPGSIPGGAVSLSSGDFDGDGRSDVLSRSASGYLGLAQLNLHYFDRSGAPLTSWSTTQLLASTTVASLSGDARSDVLFSQAAIGALLGEENRTLSPDAYPSYHIRGADVLVTPVLDLPVNDGSALLVISRVGSKLQLLRPSDSGGELVFAATLGDDDKLVDEPTTGHVFDDRERYSCRELAIAFEENPRISLYQLCKSEGGKLLWRDSPVITTLELDQGIAPSAPPLFADIDGDGHPDVVVPTELGPYVAYGDGEQLEPLRPLALQYADGAPATGSPLAAGDFTGDGSADLIMPYGLLVSERVDGKVAYLAAQGARRGPWARGLVADLNADGRLDAIAASDRNPGIEFFMGTPDGRRNSFVIPTTHAAERLCASDFDGDGISDLAFVMPDQGPGGDDQIAVAFGNAVGAPDVPVPAAHVPDITELARLSDDPNETSSDLIIVNDVSLARGDDEQHSALSLLVGSGDRRFFSPILLTTFSVDGSLEQPDSVAVTAGYFDDDERLDVAAIGLAVGMPDPASTALDFEYSLWLLPDFASGESAPRKLPWIYESRLQPVLPDPASAPLAVRFFGADLDADGRDELLFVAPIEVGQGLGDSRCLIAWAGVTDDGTALSPTRTLELEESCSYEPSVEVRDLDGDGANDLVIVTGRMESPGLTVLWNDGSGELSVDATTRIDDPGGITGFTTFEPSPHAPLLLAYTTAEGLYWLDVHADRTFSVAGALPETFGRATAVTAGDIDGDGLTDLAVADSGSVRVLKAGLSQR